MVQGSLGTVAWALQSVEYYQLGFARMGVTRNTFSSAIHKHEKIPEQGCKSDVLRECEKGH